MQAALPHVDVFLPGHNLASLETMVEVLKELDEARAAGSAEAAA